MRSGFLGVAGATAAAAVFTLLLTSTVAGSATEAGSAAFLSFWYGALIVSFGVFLPLEQVVSRAVGAHPAGAVRATAVVRLAVLLVLIAAVGVLAASPLLGADAPTRTWVTAALVALALVSALQYAVRGVALGRGRLGAYAGALLADAGLRALGAVLVALLVTRPPGAAFAACVVGSALLAHSGLLLALRRPGRARQGAGGPRAHDVHELGEFGVTHDGGPHRTGGAGGDGAAAGERVAQLTARAVLALLGASIAAQVLLNATPLLIRAVGGGHDAVSAYGFAFTLARTPLFAVVPVQAILVPPMVRMVAEGRLHELRVRMAQVAVVVLVVAGLGAAAGALVSGPAMSIYTSSEYRVAPALMALLVGGCLVHAGLVVGAQALVATGRERSVLACWGTGLAVGAVVLAVLRLTAPELSSGWTAGWAFTSGSLAGWALSVLVLVRRPAVPAVPAA